MRVGNVLQKWECFNGNECFAKEFVLVWMIYLSVQDQIEVHERWYRLMTFEISSFEESNSPPYWLSKSVDLKRQKGPQLPLDAKTSRAEPASEEHTPAKR